MAEAALRTLTLPPLWGHADARNRLAVAFARDRLAPALLLHGDPGIGKQRLALWLGQLLVCENPAETEPCGRCSGCKLAARIEHPDIHWYFPLERPSGVSEDRLADALEEARSSALAEIRSQPLRPPSLDATRGIYLAAMRTLRRSAQRRPAMARRQVFIIGEAELLVPQEASPQAANALLKLLEEPPADTTLILTSNEPGRLLATVRSRTLSVRLTALPPATVRDFLEQVAGESSDAASHAAALSGGSIGRALGFLERNGEPGPLEAVRQQARQLLYVALGDSRVEPCELALGYSPAGARAHMELFGALLSWLRDLALSASGAPDIRFNVDATDELDRLVRQRAIEATSVGAAIDAVERARTLASGNVNPQLLIATLVVELRRHLTGG